MATNNDPTVPTDYTKKQAIYGVWVDTSNMTSLIDALPYLVLWSVSHANLIDTRGVRRTATESRKHCPDCNQDQPSHRHLSIAARLTSVS